MRTVVFLIIVPALFESILYVNAKKPKEGKDAINMEQVYEANVPEDLTQMNMNNFMNLVGAYQIQQNNYAKQKKEAKRLPKSRSKISLDEEKMEMPEAEETSALPSLGRKADPAQLEEPKSYDYEERNDGEKTGTSASSSKKEISINKTGSVETKKASTSEPKTSSASKRKTPKKSVANKDS